MINKPKAFIFAGANASGKSTLIAHLLQEKIIKGTYVNPDLVLKYELKLEETKENYLKAFKLAQVKRESLLEEQKDIILETVFSTQEKIEFLKKLKVAGYHVTLFFTSTDTPYINAMYLTQRVLNGGHDVPIHKLISRRERGFANIKRATKIIDCLIYLDNSIPSQPPEIIISLWLGKKCFENSKFNRNITWHINLLEDINTSKELNDNIALMHISFCETIQKSVVTFSKTLEKSYAQKNEILAGNR
ncbi:MAG: zeta toxin family protein [Sulfurimonas sp.]